MKKNVILFLISCLLFSCQEEDEFKIPVEVNFVMDINRNANPGGFLQFDGGEIMLESFNFSGEREQASDVNFSRDFDAGLEINFDADQKIEALRIELPQGIYNDIRVNFETVNSGGENSLVIQGTYNSLGGAGIPVRVEINKATYFNITAQNQEGGNEIVLKKESPPTALIKLNPVLLFQGVPFLTFENAQLTEVNSIPTIEINENDNGGIYESMVDRLDIAFDLIFTN